MHLCTECLIDLTNVAKAVFCSMGEEHRKELTLSGTQDNIGVAQFPACAAPTCIFYITLYCTTIVTSNTSNANAALPRGRGGIIPKDRAEKQTLSLMTHNITQYLAVWLRNERRPTTRHSEWANSMSLGSEGEQQTTRPFIPPTPPVHPWSPSLWVWGRHTHRHIHTLQAKAHKGNTSTQSLTVGFSIPADCTFLLRQKQPCYSIPLRSFFSSQSS